MFRLCKVLSVLRLDVNDEYPEIIKCTDQDYQTAKSILETLKKHTMKIFTKIEKRGRKKGDLKGKKFKLFNALPDSFTRKEALEIGKKMSIASATVDRLIGTDYIESDSNGNCKKVIK